MTSSALATHPRALDTWRARNAQEYREAYQSVSVMRPSEWADRHRVLSVGPSSGLRWSNDMTPYLVEIMDFVADPWARKGVVMKASRVGYTEGVIGNLVAYFIDVDPCSIAVVQPSDGEAEAYSKEQITPLLDRNPRAGNKIGAMGIRSSDSTIRYKEFAGGFLAILGSASDRNLRRRSLRRALADEVDGMKVEGPEGDPLLRLQKRTDDYEDGVTLVGSTPTLRGQSRIEREYERSDQRRWYVPCPHCRHEQVLTWAAIKWDHDVACRGCGLALDEPAEACPACGGGDFTTTHRPETAYLECVSCHAPIDEEEKPKMVRAGRWVAERPGAPYPGWHLPAFISLFPGARWGKLAEEFLEAQEDPEDLKVWVNQVAGETWEERGQKIEATSLEARAETFPAEVPDGVGVLCAGVDVQGDRLELLVRGYGVGWETWDILHERIIGDPRAADTWSRLLFLLNRSYVAESGRDVRIDSTMIDSGFATEAVYAFVAPRELGKVWAGKGDAGKSGKAPLSRAVRANTSNVHLWTLGVFTLRDDLFNRLAVRKPGPRYVHLRQMDPDHCNGFDAEYFAQFGAEKKIRKRVPGEKRFAERFVQVRARNEAIDLHCLADAAFRGLGKERHDNMAAWVKKLRRPPPPPADERGADPAAPKKPPPRPKNWATGTSGGSGWATGWNR